MRSPKEVSTNSLSSATWQARSTGTLVNKEVTSKETRTSCPRDLFEMKVANWVEFLTFDSEFPTKGDRIDVLRGGRLEN